MLLLQQVRVIDPVSGTDQITDVLIADNIIKAIEPEISIFPANTSTRDCRGLILGPGLVDLYSHSGEPGFEERETLASLMQAAQAGGFTRIGILPDTTPPVDNPAGLARFQRSISDFVANVNNFSSTSPPLPCPPAPLLYFWGALTVGVQGQQMSELADLAAAGVIGFTDGKPFANLALLRRLLEYLKPLDQPVALWPENPELAGNSMMREGYDSIRLGLPGNPTISETSALAALLEIVEAVRTPVHIMRVSTARSVQMIWEAKVRGLPVTASTTWMPRTCPGEP